MTTETAPSYSGTLAAAQAYAQLHPAVEETLAGVTGQRLTLTPGERRVVSAADLASTANDLFVELQFERPLDVHNSIVLLARTGDLVSLPLDLAQEDDGSGMLAAESLLRLGDILSTCVDTLAPTLSWLQPTPRAWLGNLEPLAADASGLAALTLPPTMASEPELYETEVELSLDGTPLATISVIISETAERALLGLDAAGAPPAPVVSGVSAAAPAGAAADPPAAGTSPARQPAPARQPTVQPAQFVPLGPEQTMGRGNSIDLIREVPLKVSVELGRTSLTVREVLALGVGSVVELNRLAGEPVDVLVNDRLIARGEVVMVDESFGVRITDLVQQQR